MFSSTKIDMQSESIIDARSSGPYDAIDQQKQNLQPDDAQNNSESSATVERFVNPYEEDEAKYFLVPPIRDPRPPEFLRFAYLPPQGA